MADANATKAKGVFVSHSHPTYAYRVVKEPPATTPRRDRLPAVGKEFSFWHWGENVIGMIIDTGLTYDIPDIRDLEDGGFIEKVLKKVPAKKAA